MSSMNSVPGKSTWVVGWIYSFPWKVSWVVDWIKRYFNNRGHYSYEFLWKGHLSTNKYKTNFIHVYNSKSNHMFIYNQFSFSLEWWVDSNILLGRHSSQELYWFIYRGSHLGHELKWFITLAWWVDSVQIKLSLTQLSCRRCWYPLREDHWPPRVRCAEPPGTIFFQARSVIARWPPFTRFSSHRKNFP